MCTVFGTEKAVQAIQLNTDAVDLYIHMQRVYSSIRIILISQKNYLIFVAAIHVHSIWYRKSSSIQLNTDAVDYEPTFTSTCRGRLVQLE